MCADNQPPGKQSPARYDSHLFTVRVWREAINQTEAEWRGRLQHVESGQVYYFRSWNALIANMLSLLPAGSDTLPQLSPEEWATRQVRLDEGSDTEQSDGR